MHLCTKVDTVVGPLAAFRRRLFDGSRYRPAHLGLTNVVRERIRAFAPAQSSEFRAALVPAASLRSILRRRRSSCRVLGVDHDQLLAAPLDLEPEGTSQGRLKRLQIACA